MTVVGLLARRPALDADYHRFAGKPGTTEMNWQAKCMSRVSGMVPDWFCGRDMTPRQALPKVGADAHL